MLRAMMLGMIAVFALSSSAAAAPREAPRLADADRGTTCHVTKTEPIAGTSKLKCTYLCRTARGDVTLQEEFDTSDMLDNACPETRDYDAPPAPGG